MTRQQRWAKEAFACVSARKQESASGEYRSLCLKMPALLKQSGLVQSLAFMRARSGTVGRLFCEDLARVYGIGIAAGRALDQVLQERAQSADLAAYLVLSRDLIDISVWFRRFAQSELKEEASSS